VDSDPILVARAAAGDRDAFDELVALPAARVQPRARPHGRRQRGRAASSSSNTITFDVWYDLPNLRKEALMTVTVAIKDADGRTFTKVKEVRVAP
jgi:hypothetical protein